jgi:hypothetical protein
MKGIRIWLPASSFQLPASGFQLSFQPRVCSEERPISS